MNRIETGSDKANVNIRLDTNALIIWNNFITKLEIIIKIQNSIKSFLKFLFVDLKLYYLFPELKDNIVVEKKVGQGCKIFEKRNLSED